MNTTKQSKQMQQKGFDVRNKVNSNETSTPTLHSALYNTQHNTIQEHFFSLV